MALPPQAIEKLARESSATQGVYKQLLLLSLGLLILTVVVYFGITFGYTAYLDRAITDIELQSDKWSESISAADQAATASLYSQLYNLKALLGSHVFISPIFTVLERATPQGVYYTKASINVASREITLTGLAVSIDDALGVATKMESQEGVERVSFANAGKLVDGPWQFTMSVVMKEKFFNAAPNRAIMPIPPISSSTQATSTISTSSPR